jgi:antitoxin component YwqK of YwqJK toxin-antitoxin module
MAITLQFKTKIYSDWNTTDKQFHRLHGKPAYQSWYPNGQKRYEAYYENNRLHRLNGKPAYQHWASNGKKTTVGYWVHGNQCWDI